MLQHAPHAKVITSAPNGLRGLKAHYGADLPYVGVKAGDTLSLGKRTLQFVPTPMLHWPDSMVTYCPEEKILFSNDAFGEHLASSKLFDDENDLSVIMDEAKKYYANILMLYGRQAKMALKTVKSLDLDMILTGHGVSWRSHIGTILAAYDEWSAGEAKERAVIVFDSMWHSTEKMARAIEEGFRQRGIEVGFYDLKQEHLSNIATDLLTSKYVAVGSPTFNNQMMPTVAAFLSYFKGLSPRRHLAFAFGSYGWGGQSVGLVEDELKAAGCTIVLDKIRLMNVPTSAQLEEITKTVAEAELNCRQRQL